LASGRSRLRGSAARPADRLQPDAAFPPRCVGFGGGLVLLFLDRAACSWGGRRVEEVAAEWTAWRCRQRLLGPELFHAGDAFLLEHGDPTKATTATTSRRREPRIRAEAFEPAWCRRSAAAGRAGSGAGAGARWVLPFGTDSTGVRLIRGIWGPVVRDFVVSGMAAIARKQWNSCVDGSPKVTSIQLRRTPHEQFGTRSQRTE